MCGRFTLILHPEAIQNELDLGDIPPDLKPRYNISPSQGVPVVTNPENRNVEMFRWGLIPSWAKDPEIGNRLINARAETLAEKPAFRTAFSRRRCLILADGFYEWYRPGEEADTALPKARKPRPIPYYFHLGGGKPFAFAGLWDIWRTPEEEKVLSCTIITCPPNEFMSRFHNRMPVILDKNTMWDWLSPDASTGDLQSMLAPYPAERMDAYPVSPLVNNPSNDFPQCVDSITAEG